MLKLKLILIIILLEALTHGSNNEKPQTNENGNFTFEVGILFCFT